MIQRIQSLWLFVAAFLNAGLFAFDLYKSELTANGVATVDYLRINNHFPSLLLAIAITLLPLGAIFMYKNRSKQRTMVLINMVGTIGFIALTLMRVSNLNNGTSAPASGSYSIGSVLPVASLIFQIMALRGIRKDEKLVRSMDRLR